MTQSPEQTGFSHMELISTDLPRTLEFYAKAFGYAFDDVGDGYHFSTSPAGPTLGARTAAVRDHPGTLTYIQVKDVAASLKACERAGAKVLLPKTEIPNMGHFAIVLAPGSVTQGLWQSP